jgi:hypothetical protein
MTEQSLPGDAGTATLTVTDLVAALRAARGALTEITTLIGDLDRWSDELPRHHRPDPEPTLVADFLPNTDPDPAAAERALAALLDGLHEVAALADQTRVTVTATTAKGIVAFPLPAATQNQPEDTDLAR